MFEVEIAQIFETLDNISRTLDAPKWAIRAIEEDLNDAFFYECAELDTPPDVVLEVYADQMGDFSLMARSDKSKRYFITIASVVKKLKEFYMYDLFDKHLNHPEE